MSLRMRCFMNPYTSPKNSKGKYILWMDQKEMASANDWAFQNYRKKIKVHDSEKRQHDRHECGRKIICKSYDPFHDDFKTMAGFFCFKCLFSIFLSFSIRRAAV